MISKKYLKKELKKVTNFYMNLDNSKDCNSYTKNKINHQFQILYYKGLWEKYPCWKTTNI